MRSTSAPGPPPVPQAQAIRHSILGQHQESRRARRDRGLTIAVGPFTAWQADTSRECQSAGVVLDRHEPFLFPSDDPAQSPLGETRHDDAFDDELSGERPRPDHLIARFDRDSSDDEEPEHMDTSASLTRSSSLVWDKAAAMSDPPSPLVLPMQSVEALDHLHRAGSRASLSSFASSSQLSVHREEDEMEPLDLDMEPLSPPSPFLRRSTSSSTVPASPWSGYNEAGRSVKRRSALSLPLSGRAPPPPVNKIEPPVSPRSERTRLSSSSSSPVSVTSSPYSPTSVATRKTSVSLFDDMNSGLTLAQRTANSDRAAFTAAQRLSSIVAVAPLDSNGLPSFPSLARRHSTTATGPLMQPQLARQVSSPTASGFTLASIGGGRRSSLPSRDLLPAIMPTSVTPTPTTPPSAKRHRSSSITFAAISKLWASPASPLDWCDVHDMQFAFSAGDETHQSARQLMRFLRRRPQSVDQTLMESRTSGRADCSSTPTITHTSSPKARIAINYKSGEHLEIDPVGLTLEEIKSTILRARR